MNYGKWAVVLHEPSGKIFIGLSSTAKKYSYCRIVASCNSYSKACELKKMAQPEKHTG